MGYTAAQWDAVYGPLSGHCLVERKASLLSLFLSIYLSPPLSPPHSLSLFLPIFPFLSVFLLLPLSTSLSLPLSHSPPRTGLEPPLFYYFQTRHFFSETALSLSPSLSLSLWAWRCATLQKNMLEIATGRPALLGVINVNGWTSSPAEGDLSLGSQSRRVRIFFHT